MSCKMYICAVVVQEDLISSRPLIIDTLNHFPAFLFLLPDERLRIQRDQMDQHLFYHAVGKASKIHPRRLPLKRRVRLAIRAQILGGGKIRAKTGLGAKYRVWKG
jgi:hypothetical protein